MVTPTWKMTSLPMCARLLWRCRQAFSSLSCAHRSSNSRIPRSCGIVYSRESASLSSCLSHFYCGDRTRWNDHRVEATWTPEASGERVSFSLQVYRAFAFFADALLPSSPSSRKTYFISFAESTVMRLSRLTQIAVALSLALLTHLLIESLSSWS